MLTFLPKPELLEKPAKPLPPLFRQLWVLTLGLIVTEVFARFLNEQSFKLSGASLIWLPNGLLIGALLCSPRKRWLPFLASGLVLDCLTNVIDGNHFTSAICFALCNTMEIVLASSLLYSRLNPRADLTNAKQLRAFLLYGVVVAPAITSLLASLFLYFYNGIAFTQSWRAWFAADMLGIATMTPLYLSYHHEHAFSFRSKRELIALFTALCVVLFLVFGYSNYPTLWAVLLILLLLGVRAGFTASALGLLLVIIIGGYFTITGHGTLGLYTRHSLGNRMFFFQVFAGISTVALYITEVAMTANRAAQSGLMRSEALYRSLADELEGRVEERTRELQQQISEREVIQNNLINAKLLAEEANRAKSAFLANMSHELRTPLNVILGYSEMLEEDARTAGQTGSANDLLRIQKAGRHLLNIINDVLDLSKIEAGRIELFEDPIVISKFVDDIVATIEPLARKQQNRLVVEIDRPEGNFIADPIKFKQCVLNLLGNACKFTERGVITLSVTHPGEDSPFGLCWSITDTGIGIADADRQQLFRAFSQVDSSTTRRHDGTGLGLVITQRLVQLMGGEIALESKLNHGSTFTINLPKSRVGTGTS